MNNKGVTLIELIIVIIIISIIATLTTVSVGTYLSNAKKQAFISNTNVIISAAESSYLLERSLWVDDEITLGKLITHGYLDSTPQDPYGGEYSLDDTIITASVVNSSLGVHIIPVYYLSTHTTNFESFSVLFSCTIITTKATLGEDTPLHYFTINDIVLLDHTDTIIDNNCPKFRWRCYR